MLTAALISIGYSKYLKKADVNQSLNNLIK